MGTCCQATPTSCCSSGNKDKEDTLIYLRLAVATVIAGQSMMWGLGVNITDLSPSDHVYWWLHGILIGSALAVTLLLGGPLFKNTWRSFKERKITVEALFLLSFLGAFTGSLISSIQGKGDVYYEVVAIVFLIYNIGQLLNRVSRKKALEETDRLRVTFDQAHILDEYGNTHLLHLKDITLEQTVVVAPGEAITVTEPS